MFPGFDFEVKVSLPDALKVLQIFPFAYIRQALEVKNDDFEHILGKCITLAKACQTDLLFPYIVKSKFQ